MTTLFPGDTNDAHHFLATGDTMEQACQQTRHFLDTTQLVAYQSNRIPREAVLPATSERFWIELETGIAANRRFCEALLQELRDTGLERAEDLLGLQQGYPSKLLHILTHMLDGFIGIDSVFYNLIEDSHWLSEPLRATIRRRPEIHWLVPVWHGPATSVLLDRSQKGLPSNLSSDI